MSFWDPEQSVFVTDGALRATAIVLGFSWRSVDGKPT